MSSSAQSITNGLPGIPLPPYAHRTKYGTISREGYQLATGSAGGEMESVGGVSLASDAMLK